MYGAGGEIVTWRVGREGVAVRKQVRRMDRSSSGVRSEGGVAWDWESRERRSESVGGWGGASKFLFPALGLGRAADLILVGRRGWIATILLWGFAISATTKRPRRTMDKAPPIKIPELYQT
jgi:hypothetical protein